MAADREFRMSQQYFHQAVILVLEHHEQGSMGVILNRPTQYDMGYVERRAGGTVREERVVFRRGCRRRDGEFFARTRGRKGSVEVLPGVYLGGYENACELVQMDGSTCDAEEFKFFGATADGDPVSSRASASEACGTRCPRRRNYR